jgi:hypothetical protein
VPVFNRPIESNKALGQTKSVLGIFSETMVPGLILAIVVFALSQKVCEKAFGRKEIAFIPAFSVLAAFYLAIGNSPEKAWKTVTKWTPQRKLHLHSGENADIFRDRNN